MIEKEKNQPVNSEIFVAPRSDQSLNADGTLPSHLTCLPKRKVIEMPESDLLLDALHHAIICISRHSVIHRLNLLFHGTLLVTLPLGYLLMRLYPPDTELIFLGVVVASLMGIGASMQLENLIQRRYLRSDELTMALEKHLYRARIDETASGEVVPGNSQCRTCDLVQMLLQGLRCSDAPLLTTAHRQAIVSLLSDPEPSLVLAALKALEQVGDREAVSAVRELIDSTPNLHLREAAQSCLEFLKVDALRHRQSVTLLRPSQSGDQTPENLLRPANAGSENTPEQLLRPLE